MQSVVSGFVQPVKPAVLLDYILHLIQTFVSRNVVLKKICGFSVDIIGLSWIFCGFCDFVDFCGFFKALTWIFHSGKTATLQCLSIIV